MKLIWKELLHANYRCGRMRTNRAQASGVYWELPSAARLCTRMWRRQLRWTTLPGAPLKTHRDFLYTTIILLVYKER